MSVLVSGAFAKRIDRYAIDELGIPSLELMARAAEGLAAETERLADKHFPDKKRQDVSILFLCGTGNNGADGLNAAHILSGHGFREIRIGVLGDRRRCTEEFRFHERALEEAGMALTWIDSVSGDEAGTPDIVVDALFGIGLSRPVEGRFLELIGLINELRDRGSLIISADVPSGLDSDLGHNMCGPSMPVRAHETVTFGFDKTGLWLGMGLSVRGELCQVDIGYEPDICSRIPHDIYDVIETTDIEQEDIKCKLRRRGLNANKSTYGKLLIIGGSRGMAGAAYLSGLAAYRSGMGMVRYLGPECNRSILQTLLPEAMYDSCDEVSRESILKVMRPAFDWADHFVLGPGLSRSEEAELMVRTFAELWSEAQKKLLVLDADGLNFLAAHEKLSGMLLGPRTVITPHVGEMARLVPESIADIKADPLRIARDYALTHHVNVILKDAVTVTADAEGKLHINTEGSAALSKAGSGDVLTGAVAGVCAVLGDDISKALPAAVCLHGLAGRLGAEGISEHGSLARDTADALPRAFLTFQEESLVI